MSLDDFINSDTHNGSNEQISFDLWRSCFAAVAIPASDSV